MHKNLDRPAAVLFDLDNTLYAYEPAHRVAMRAVEAKVSRLFGIDHESFERAFNAARKDVKHRVGKTAASHSRLLYFQRVIELLGLKTQPLLSLDLEQTYWRTFLGHATLFDGVSELLDELALLSIPKAIVTDLTAQIQFRKLVYFRLEDIFDAVVTSEESGAEKPHKVNFTMALEKLGVKSGTIWMIGDDVEKDMQGAKAAVSAVTFLRVDQSLFPRSKPEWCDYTFERFEIVTEALRLSGSSRIERGRVGNE